MCVSALGIHADTEVLNFFLRHSDMSFSEGCHYDAQERIMPQSDYSRMSPAVLNGSFFDYSHQGLRRTMNNITASGFNMKEVPRTLRFEKPLLDVQEYQSFVEDVSTNIPTWSYRHHSLPQASKTASKYGGGNCVHGAASCLDPSLCNLHEGPPQIQEKNARVSHSLTEVPLHIVGDDAESGHPSRKDPCTASLSKHATDVMAMGSATASTALCRVPQPMKFPILFPRTSQPRSLHRRVLKKIDGSIVDAMEGNILSSSLGTKRTELPSASPALGPIVESPDWLPPGWLTEMKTRASGSSAGCKYKCYVDPVTSRRFRTKKEVFCFLRTGNTGRYKPKPRAEENEEQANNEASLQGPASGLQSSWQPTSLAGGTHVNGLSFLPISWRYLTGRSSYGRIVSIQAAALKLLTDDDDMTLEEKARLFARFSPRPLDLYGLRIPAKNFKRAKAQGNEGLEALGKVICQQGLSILRRCSNK